MFIIHQCNGQTNNKSYKNQIVHFRIVIQQNHAYINITIPQNKHTFEYTKKQLNPQIKYTTECHTIYWYGFDCFPK